MRVQHRQTGGSTRNEGEGPESGISGVENRERTGQMVLQIFPNNEGH